MTTENGNPGLQKKSYLQTLMEIESVNVPAGLNFLLCFFMILFSDQYQHTTVIGSFLWFMGHIVPSCYAVVGLLTENSGSSAAKFHSATILSRLYSGSWYVLNLYWAEMKPYDPTAGSKYDFTGCTLGDWVLALGFTFLCIFICGVVTLIIKMSQAEESKEMRVAKSKSV